MSEFPPVRECPQTATEPPLCLSTGLPECLEFTGEFGAEVNSFVPFVYWLHRAGLMHGRRIRTYRGMRPFYFFLDGDQVKEIDGLRRFVFPRDRPVWLPTRDDHRSNRSPFEMFPDYREHFRDGMFDVGRPLLIVHNKVTSEWGRPPVNMFPIVLLDRIFNELAPLFHVVYLRPGLRGTPQDYSRDQQANLPFDDLSLLKRHPAVEIFDEMATTLSSAMSYNELKLRLYAHADYHITVQGGNAHLLSMFRGGMVAILHRAGQEIYHSYARGHFTYAAAPPPRWLICRNEADIARCIGLFQSAIAIDGQVLLPLDCAPTVLDLSPNAQWRPHRA